MEIPEGWTDDMRISLRPGLTVPDVVAPVMKWLAAQRDFHEMHIQLEKEFGLSREDSLLALDRIQGGIIRALTGLPENEPDQTKDPMAWHSFSLVWHELPTRHWFSKRRRAVGPWKTWFEQTSARKLE